MARLTKEVVRRGCPYGERASASRLRRVASFRSCVAPSWLYRWKRRLERISKEVDRRGCSWGQRSSASRASTRPGPALPQVAGTGRRARGRLHKEMNRSGCPFGRRENASWFEDSCLAKIRHSSQPVVTSDDRDDLQGESMKQIAWDGRVGEVPMLHDQGQLPGQCDL